MAAPRMGEDDVGSVYVDAAGAAWRLIAYTRSPTVTLERLVPSSRIEASVDLDARRTGVVGALMFDGFRKLVPEDDG